MDNDVEPVILAGEVVVGKNNQMNRCLLTGF
jgi:hypothetical protein